MHTEQLETNNPNNRYSVHQHSDTHGLPDAVPVLLFLKEAHRRRVDLLSAENRLLLQIKSICRRLVSPKKPPGQAYTKTELAKIRKDAAQLYKQKPLRLRLELAPLFEAHAVLHQNRLDVEKKFLQEIRKLSIYPWAMNIRGFGEINLGNIIAEAGDLSNYSTVGKLWKRFGVAVLEGMRQRRTKNKELAIAMAFSPRRRAVLFNLGECLVKQNKDGTKPGKYRALYLARKEIEQAKAKAAGVKMSKAHIANRARSYMEKRVLRDLWKAWRRYNSLTANVKEAA